MVVGAGVALLVVLVLVVGGSVLLDDGGGDAQAAGLRLAGEGSSVRGVGFFEQDGEQVTGFVAVWGLEPNTEHAVHFHGPSSECGTTADPVAAHPDLKADQDGVAFQEVDLTAAQQLFTGGFYYNVHEGPSSQAENPEIACGTSHPTPPRLRPADAQSFRTQSLELLRPGDELESSAWPYAKPSP